MVQDDDSVSDQPSGGIRNISFGFGPMPASARPLAPLPPYRLLVAGDFGIDADGRVHDTDGLDIAEFLSAHPASLSLEVENKFGDSPSRVAADLRLATLADLRPRSLIDQFTHHRRAVAAAEGTDEAPLSATAYAKLAALVQARAGPASAAGPKSGTHRPADADADTDDVDDLGALFDLVDVSGATRPNEQKSSADFVSDFIRDNMTADTRTLAGGGRKPGGVGAVRTLLDEQAHALFTDPRLCRVLENWQGLRLLLQMAGGGRETAIALLQVNEEVDRGELNRLLAGDAGVLGREFYDLVLLADRCAATNDDATLMRAVAEAADTFGGFAFMTLDPDFAGVPADRLGGMDTPSHLLAGAGFEIFRSLRATDAAENMALFWNDALALEASAINPALFIPAAWLAAAMTIVSVRNVKWPLPRGSDHRQLDGFPVAMIRHQGREVAVATRCLPTGNSVGDLASAGITAFNGHPDRDSVHMAQGRLLSERADQPYGPKLADRLVAVRIANILQGLVPQAVAGAVSAEDKAAALEKALGELAVSLGQDLRFRVTVPEVAGDPTLDVGIQLPSGLASMDRFDFQIPI